MELLDRRGHGRRENMGMGRGWSVRNWGNDGRSGGRWGVIGRRDYGGMLRGTAIRLL